MQVFDPKKVAAEKAVEFVKDGMAVALGTGSTAFWAIQKLGSMVKQGLKIQTVASSIQSENLAKQLNIPMLPIEEVVIIDVALDGADEVDRRCNLIKGGGGALLREKVLAANSQKFVVMVDSSKVVEKLGRFPLAVEVIPFAVNLTLRQLEDLGCKAAVRTAQNQNFISDNGNLIIDCNFETITSPQSLSAQINMVPGVMESGIFLSSMVHAVVIGYQDGSTRIIDLTI